MHVPFNSSKIGLSGVWVRMCVYRGNQHLILNASVNHFEACDYPRTKDLRAPYYAQGVNNLREQTTKEKKKYRSLSVYAYILVLKNVNKRTNSGTKGERRWGRKRTFCIHSSIPKGSLSQLAPRTLHYVYLHYRKGIRAWGRMSAMAGPFGGSIDWKY